MTGSPRGLVAVARPVRQALQLGARAPKGSGRAQAG
jgi:hypothetical protein